ncbi:MAG: sulfatase [Prosthecobacter sp.]
MKSIVLLLLASVFVSLSHARAADVRPNILIFYVDDMGWAQPGCYGGRTVPTPNINSLAAGGVRFTNGYSSGCICSPGRVGLMTGRYQARTGHDANPGRAGRELLLSEITIGQHLKTAGYTTGIVGKWHLGDTSAEFMPLARGFDFAMGTLGNLGEGSGPSYYRGKELLQELEGAPITSPVFARESVKFIEDQKDKDKPWFLCLSFNAMHTPHVASEKWLEKFKDLPKRDAAYAALAAEADEAVGTVMTKLRELRQEENTLIFLISDNGGAAPQAEMGGLRGRKWFVWEGGIRVSWIAAWKGHVPAGRVSAEPVIQLDVLPTALAAAGATSSVPLDGVNLLPLLQGKTEKLEPRELYFRFGVQHAVRQGDWKLVKASKDMQPMLINLATDPGEQTDLTTKEPEKAAVLQKLFDQWNASMQPPRWEDQRWNGAENRKEQKKDKKKKKTNR